MAFINMVAGGKHLFVGDKFAIWNEPESGDPFAPYKDPDAHVRAIHTHSDWDRFVQALDPTTTTINHDAYDADPGTVIVTPNLIVAYDTEYLVTRPLLTHGLPYVPDFQVQIIGVDNQLLPQGYPIQHDATGGRRFIIPYANETAVGIQERVLPSQSGLPAISVTYRVIAFRTPGDVPGAHQFMANLDELMLARGRIDSDVPGLRRAVTGESGQFFISLVDNIGLDNGQARFRAPDGTVVTTGPTSGTQAFGGATPVDAAIKAVLS